MKIKHHKELLKTYEQYREHHPLPPAPETLYEPIDYIMSLGGKRIRPVICLLAHQIFKPIDDNVLTAAHGLEMFHNFSLVHDDIMDHADVRRGKPTVHKKWDESTGILSGDQMLIEAFRLMRQGSKNLAVLERFEAMSTEVCEGQRKDMDFESMSEVSEDDYLEMIRQKTAVLLGFSMWCGGLIATGKHDIAEKFYTLGTMIGVGFQIMDDLLDCYGDERFGKKIGGDILEGKKTLLYIRCYDNANGEDRVKLNQLMTSGDLSDDERINGVLELYDKYLIKTLVTATMDQYFGQADKILAEIEEEGVDSPEGFKELVNYIHSVQNREK